MKSVLLFSMDVIKELSPNGKEYSLSENKYSQKENDKK